jgi:C1A family cysteine protease
MGERFYTPPGGLVEPGPTDADVAYHAVIAVGHGKSAAGEVCILIRNSWGEDWAMEGYGWITASYLAPRLTSTLVMEPGTKP